MAKIERGSAELISVDTEKKTMLFRRAPTVHIEDETLKEWECPYLLAWEDKEFSNFIGRFVDYVLSDGKVVELTYAK